MEKKFLFEGYADYFKSMIPSDKKYPYVLCHNDVLEGNILMKNGQN